MQTRDCVSLFLLLLRSNNRVIPLLCASNGNAYAAHCYNDCLSASWTYHFDCFKRRINIMFFSHLRSTSHRAIKKKPAEWPGLREWIEEEKRATNKPVSNPFDHYHIFGLLRFIEILPLLRGDHLQLDEFAKVSAVTRLTHFLCAVRSEKSRRARNIVNRATEYQIISNWLWLVPVAHRRSARKSLHSPLFPTDRRATTFSAIAVADWEIGRNLERGRSLRVRSLARTTRRGKMMQLKS